MPLKWIPCSKSGASKSRPRWAAHTCIDNVWEYPPPPRAWNCLFCSFSTSPIQYLTCHHLISFELPDTFLTFLILSLFSIMCNILRLRNLFLFYFFFVSNEKSRAHSRWRSQPCWEGNRELSCMKETLLADACGTVERGGEGMKMRGMERENGLFPFMLFSNSPFAHLPWYTLFAPQDFA